MYGWQWQWNGYQWVWVYLPGGYITDVTYIGQGAYFGTTSLPSGIRMARIGQPGRNPRLF
jgi:hypothetical protein